MLTFVGQCLTVGKSLTASPDDLYAAWCAWCVNDGGTDPGSARVFGRKLSAAVPGLKRRFARDDSKKMVRLYEGVAVSRRLEPDDHKNVSETWEVTHQGHIIDTSRPVDDVSKPNDVIYL
jgi:phage/plasmid-associated DNA primase